ncbi:DUF445 domain-containing protein [Pseudalkalibacillus berkeleyi]|uniref:DUF445 family protein n=1 Tax=Pseudalkalibacillus berkeleyi TaxID=1069813 RepID=A0ABS9GTJ6_9BACL|nr:DUF445 family protein [Pseudalkalibacillus berkeleyi]MCF6136153.1 DUF445 family protein [Pseudalkalibacillus berkeleyi]
MQLFWMMAMMIVIGAAIGGFTNSLAIKMLFRPYNAIMIGKFKLPFTPGLIPKRREELAVQLGQMTVNHLITKEGLQQKLQQSEFKNELVTWAQGELKKQLEQDCTLNDLGAFFLKQEDLDVRVEGQLKTYLNQKISEKITAVEAKPLNEVVPEAFINNVEAYIPKTTDFIQSRLIAFVRSPEGKQQLKYLVDDFLADRGMLGNMINMFLGNESLIDKVQSELVKLLQRDTVSAMLERVLKQEWNELKEKPASDIIDFLKLKSGQDYVIDYLVRQVDMKSIFNTPVRDLIAQHIPYLEEDLIPHVTDHALNWVGNNVEQIMEKMQLSELVRQQVQTFSVQRLEEMVLSISRRELKMITYLGALLGGGIGFIQGLLVYFLT